MFYMVKEAGWLLFVLLIQDINQIKVICCKVIKMLEICDICYTIISILKRMVWR